MRARSIRGYRDLEVWQKAMVLVELCYRVTRQYPITERYGLCSQARRAAISVPANIAEGQGREHLGDYLRHLSIANGSSWNWRRSLKQRAGWGSYQKPNSHSSRSDV